MYVTAYEVTRHYGGPEEGGWWYDHFQPIETWEVDDDVDETRELLAHRWAHLAHGDIGSVLGGAEVQVVTEDYPEQYATRERVRYE